MIAQIHSKINRIFLLGYPIAHSLSPAMHNAALHAVGLDDWRYELLEKTRHELPDALARIRADDCVGANVTIPHKETVVKLLDDLAASARKVDAVNTIVKRDGKLIGENTEIYGFAETMREAHIHPRHARVVIIGAGGGARAIAFALAEAGAASIVLLNRTTMRAAILADILHEHFPHLALAVNLTDALKTANIIVNATAVGMSPDVNATPMPSGYTFPRGAVAFDLVYNPPETQFLRDAQQAEARPIGGLGMLVHQGAAAFKLWTGRDAPVPVMFEAARRELKGRQGTGR
jgi:shikimate dehydrogenase